MVAINGEHHRDSLLLLALPFPLRFKFSRFSSFSDSKAPADGVRVCFEFFISLLPWRDEMASILPSLSIVSGINGENRGDRGGKGGAVLDKLEIVDLRIYWE